MAFLDLDDPPRSGEDYFHFLIDEYINAPDADLTAIYQGRYWDVLIAEDETADDGAHEFRIRLENPSDPVD